MAKSDLNPELLANVALVFTARTRIRDLRDFHKGLQIPTEFTPRTKQFAAKLTTHEIGVDLEERYAAFRQHLNFRRVDLKVAETTAGSGTITTPWFDYQVIATLDPDDVTQILWLRRIAEFRDSVRLLSDEFAATFGKQFDTVQLTPTVPIILPDLIDSIESRRKKTVTLDYDRNATWCTVRIHNIPVCMRVTSDLISFVTSTPMTAARLLEAFLKLRSQLLAIEA